MIHILLVKMFFRIGINRISFSKSNVILLKIFFDKMNALQLLITKRMSTKLISPQSDT